MFKKLTAALICLMMVIMCTSCKPAETALSDQVGSETVEVSLKKALQNLFTYESFKCNINIDMDAGGQKMSLSASVNADEKANEMAMEMKLNQLGITMSLQTYIKDNQIYMMLPMSAKYMQYDLSSMQESIPFQISEEDIAGAIDKINFDNLQSEKETITVNGLSVKAVTYSYSLSKADLENWISSHSESVGEYGEMLNMLDFKTLTLKCSVSETGYLVKADVFLDMAVNFSSAYEGYDFSGIEGLESFSGGMADMSMNIIVEIYDVNLPANIVFPEFNDSNTQKITGDADDMGSFMEGFMPGLNM